MRTKNRFTESPKREIKNNCKRKNAKERKLQKQKWEKKTKVVVKDGKKEENEEFKKFN